MLFGYPRVPLRSTLGYFRAFPPGTLSLGVPPLVVEISGAMLRFSFLAFNVAIVFGAL